MARPLRMDYPGAWCHVMNRGIERRSVFLNDDDRRHFLRLLASMEENFGVEVHVYCLMENHFHLALHTPEANLSRAMRWLGQSYGQSFRLLSCQCWSKALRKENAAPKGPMTTVQRSNQNVEWRDVTPDPTNAFSQLR